MSFLETVERVRAFLQRNRRVSLRALRREFELEGEVLEELVLELVDVQRVAVREGGALAWSDGAPAEPPGRDPRADIPPHLADKIRQSRPTLEGERKQVTVLFADVKGSTALTEQAGPERWAEVLEGYLRILAEGVHRFEGTVSQYTGDGLMALFGAPIAHEDHAARACLAALWLRDALAEYAAQVRREHALALETRIGLNSGEVVVGKIGEDLGMDFTAQGQTVHLAKRMEQLAEAGRPCLAPATSALVEGLFALDDRGEFYVKGVSKALRVHALVGPGEAQTRLDAARSRGLSPFVGRVPELASLDAAHAQARAGRGQIVGVVGEAGVGKSRLCAQFLDRARAQGVPVYAAHCVSHGKTLTFLPMRELVRALLGISGSETETADARRKAAVGLGPTDDTGAAVLPLLFDFLDIADPEASAPQLPPEARQRRLFDLVRRLVRARSADEPVVLFLDDAHWIDAGSDAFLAQIAETVADTQALLLVNFRPEYQADWMARSEYQQLPLRRLGAEETDALLDELLGRDDSFIALRELVRERTGGNPFFVEEVVRSLVESGALEGARGAYRLAQTVEALEVPSTVQPVLAGRIDRLAEREKQALQAAAVIGKELSAPILSAVLDWPEPDVFEALQALKASEFLLERSLYPVTELAFKHPLTQEVALGSQLRERRVRTHAAVAKALEAAHADHLDEQAALIAHHHEGAGDALAAARWHARAAAWLIKTDMGATIEHYRRVYELAGSETSTAEARKLRLGACVMLLMTSPFIGLPEGERERLASEARDLAERLGDLRALAEVEQGLANSRILSGWSRGGPFEPARRALEIAQELDLETRAKCHVTYANVLFNMGRLEKGLEETVAALGLADTDAELGMGSHGASNANFARWQESLLLMWLGRPREAEACFERSREGFRQRNEPLIEILTSIFLWAPIEELTGTPKNALSRTRQALKYVDDFGIPFGNIFSWLYLGWAHLLCGHVAEALESLLRADDLQRGAGVGLIQVNLGQGLLAEAHLAAGERENARTVARRWWGELDTWVFDLRGLISRARVLRALDGEGAREEIETTLARAQERLDKSGARSLAPFVVEERARLAVLLGDEAGATRLLHQSRDLFAEVDATGHVERLEKELGA